MEASSGSQGDAYTIESPYVATNNSFCFTFWYNGNGNTIGSLYIYDRSVLLSTIEGNSGDDTWIKVELTIKRGLHQVGDYKSLKKNSTYSLTLV